MNQLYVYLYPLPPRPSSQPPIPPIQVITIIFCCSFLLPKLLKGREWVKIAILTLWPFCVLLFSQNVKLHIICRCMTLDFLRFLVLVLLPKCFLGPLFRLTDGLNHVPHPNSSLEALTPKMNALKCRTYERVIMVKWSHNWGLTPVGLVFSYQVRETVRIRVSSYAHRGKVMWGHNKPERELSPESNFPASWSWISILQKIIPVVKPSHLWYFVMAAPAD